MLKRNKKLASRLLAALMALACVLTLLPGAAMAAGEDDGGRMVVDKTATLEDDGTYTIELSAYATGTTTTVTTEEAVPYDIVLVLDQSGSMSNRFGSGRTTKLDALKTAARDFVQNIQEDAEKNDVDHRVAVVGFASTREWHSDSWWSPGYYEYGNTEILSTSSVVNYEDADSSDYRNALVSANSNGSVNTRLTSAINRLEASGDTYSEYGLDMANQIFENNSIAGDSNRGRLVVMFTDGYTAPSGTNNIDYSMSDRAIGNAKVSKTDYGATVYTVGIFSDANPSLDIDSNFSYGSTNANRQTVAANRYMHYVSSNYPNAQDLRNGGEKKADTYYLAASDVDQLDNIFQTISDTVTTPSTTVKLNAASVMRDILNDGFVLPEGYNASNITVKTQHGEKLDNQEEPEWGQVVENPTGITATFNVEKGTIEVTGFDYSTRYIAKTHPGDKLLVTIRGIEATDEAITNEEISTNKSSSGIYENAEAEDPSVTFPEPKTILKSKTYVLDYGKSVDLASTDWGMGQITTLDGSGMHRFNTQNPITALSLTYGSVLKGNGVDVLTYTPMTMNWKGYDKLYVFGKQIQEAEGGLINQWSRVTVMPANSVYYEDTFVTDSNTGKVGIEYTGDWKQVVEGTSDGNTQTVDDEHPYGWEKSYDDVTFSDGCAHCVTASDDEVAQASFTFTGTGVDVYSKTDMTTGTVYAVLEPQFKSENAKVQRLIVDNLAVSNGETGYYQIPTVSFQDLTYGEYKVTVMVTTAAEGRSTYYLDGVRVYNPIQGLEEDQLVQDAYGADHELNAVFQEVRDILVTQANLPEGDKLPNNSVVFIDQVEEQTGVTTSEVGTYVEYGPKNEVYLAPGQAIAFRVSTGSNLHYYLGLKGPAGATQAEATSETGKMQIGICGSCDMYYEVTPNADGIVMVKNTGENLLSITKLRTTSDSEDENAGIVGASVSELLAYADTFDSLEVVEYPTDLGDVEIENPDVQELGDGSVAWEWLQKIFRGIWDLLRP